MDSEGNVRAAGRGRATEDSGSMLIKLSHIDPSKALIKKHYSLVLRAESPAEKYSWMLRLKRCAEGPGAYVAPPSRAALAAPPVGGAKKGPPPSMGSLGPPRQEYQQVLLSQSWNLYSRKGCAGHVCISSLVVIYIDELECCTWF